MISKIINEEHIPDNAPIATRIGQQAIAQPDGPIAQVRGNLPIQQDSEHVRRPDPDESMQHAEPIEFGEALRLDYLIKQSDCNQEPADPEESIYGKVGSRHKGRYARRSQYIKSLHPILNIHESKPHVMAEDNPEDRKHSHAIQEKQILILGCLRNRDNLAEIMREGETFKDLDRDILGCC